MEVRSTGLILRTRPLTETSLIVQWLTPELGRIATAAKGARRPKSPFAGKLDLFHVAEFAFVRSRRSDLHTLREAVLRETFPALRTDLRRLQRAAYLARLVEATTETETPLPAVHALLLDAVRQIAGSASRPETVLAFELRLLAELGLAPPLDRDSLPRPGAHELAGHLATRPWDDLASADREAVAAVARFLHGFLIHHLERLPSGRGDALTP
ncbi:MAG: DNA repair protein RecO [Limisphaerales bacterium]